MERDWHFLILAYVRVSLPAFRASLPPSFFLGEEHTYVVCTYGVFSPLPLGPLSVASCFTPVAAPSTCAALDLWVGAGGSPSGGHAKKEKELKKKEKNKKGGGEDKYLGGGGLRAEKNKLKLVLGWNQQLSTSIAGWEEVSGRVL